MSDMYQSIHSSKWDKPFDWPSWIRWIQRFQHFPLKEDFSELSIEQGQEVVSNCTLVVEQLIMFTNEWESIVLDSIEQSGTPLLGIPPSHPFSILSSHLTGLQWVFGQVMGLKRIEEVPLPKLLLSELQTLCMKTRDVYGIYFSTNGKWIKGSKDNDQWCNVMEVISMVRNIHHILREIARLDHTKEFEHWIKMIVSMSFIVDDLISLFVQNPSVDVLEVYENIHREDVVDRKVERREWTSRILSIGSNVVVDAMSAESLRDILNREPLLEAELNHVSSRSIRKCVDWLGRLAVRSSYANTRMNAVTEIVNIAKVAGSSPRETQAPWMSSIQSVCVICSMKLCGGELWKCDEEEIKRHVYFEGGKAASDSYENLHVSVPKELKLDICSLVFERIVFPFGKEFLPSMLLLRCICVALVDQMAWCASERDSVQPSELVEFPPSETAKGPFPSVFLFLDDSSFDEEQEKWQKMSKILHLTLLGDEREPMDGDADVCSGLERFPSEEDAIVTSIGFLAIIGLNFPKADQDVELGAFCTHLCEVVASSIGTYLTTRDTPSLWRMAKRTISHMRFESSIDLLMKTLSTSWDAVGEKLKSGSVEDDISRMIPMMDLAIEYFTVRDRCVLDDHTSTVLISFCLRMRDSIETMLSSFWRILSQDDAIVDACWEGKLSGLWTKMDAIMMPLFQQMSSTEGPDLEWIHAVTKESLYENKQSIDNVLVLSERCKENLDEWGFHETLFKLIYEAENSIVTRHIGTRIRKIPKDVEKSTQKEKYLLVRCVELFNRCDLGNLFEILLPHTLSFLDDFRVENRRLGFRMLDRFMDAIAPADFRLYTDYIFETCFRLTKCTHPRFMSFRMARLSRILFVDPEESRMRILLKQLLHQRNEIDEEEEEEEEEVDSDDDKAKEKGSKSTHHSDPSIVQRRRKRHRKENMEAIIEGLRITVSRMQFHVILDLREICDLILEWMNYVVYGEPAVQALMLLRDIVDVAWPRFIPSRVEQFRQRLLDCEMELDSRRVVTGKDGDSGEKAWKAMKKTILDRLQEILEIHKKQQQK